MTIQIDDARASTPFLAIRAAMGVAILAKYAGDGRRRHRHEQRCSSTTKNSDRIQP